MGKKVSGAITGGLKGFITGGGNPLAAAAGAAGGFLGAKSRQRPEATESSSLSPWARGQFETATGAINSIALDPNNARRVAGLNADDLAGMQMTRDAAGVGAEDLAYASGTARDLSGAITEDEIRGFYNPFERDVVAATQADIDYSRQVAEQSAGAAATAAGAFGGDREAVYKAQLAGDVLRSGGQTIASLRAGGYRDAMGMAGTNRQLRLAGNAQLRDMVAARRDAAYGDAAARGTVGALQRGVEQAGYDSAYEWNGDRMRTLLGTMGAMPRETTTTAYGPSQSSGARAVAGATGALGTLEDLTRVWRERNRGPAPTAPSGMADWQIAAQVGRPDLSDVRLPSINWGP